MSALQELRRDYVDDLAWRASASRFARRCSLLGYAPDSDQRAILDCTDDAMLLCTRQFGKSVTVAVKASHHGATTRDGLVLVTSPAERQSIEALLKIKLTLRETEVAEVRRDSATTLELTNGCRYFALPGHEHTIRGFSAVTLLIVDEAARVPGELFEAVSPMMAVSGGQTLLLSSAWFKMGFFFKQWQEDTTRYRRFKVTADQCPRITAKFLQQERETTYRGRPAAFLREYMCEFQDLEGAAFDIDYFDLAVGRASGDLIGSAQMRHSDDIRVLFGGT